MVRIGISLQSSGALVMMDGVGFPGKMVRGVVSVARGMSYRRLCMETLFGCLKLRQHSIWQGVANLEH